MPRSRRLDRASLPAGCRERTGERQRRLRPRLLALGMVLAALLFSRAAGATVAEQRARLPPPAECEDPVEGIWRAHQFAVARNEWYIFTLEVHRVKPGSSELT